MRKWALRLCGLVIGFVHVCTHALSPELEAIASGLASSSSVSGTFVQEKTLTVLPNPLLSNGVFSFSEQEGMEWRTLSPIEHRLTIAPDGSLRASDRVQPPAMKELGGLFSALLKGDFGALSKYFEIEVLSHTGTSWEVRLTPSDSLLSHVFSHIHLKGGAQIDQIVLLEASGNKTLITLSYQAQQASGHED